VTGRLVERSNRTLQTEWVYRHVFTTNDERSQALQPWLEYYSHQRNHTKVMAWHNYGSCEGQGKRRHMCTNLVMRAQNGATVVGRTMEFGHPLDSQIAVLPRGFVGVSSGPSGPGKQWTADYGVIGMSEFDSAQTRPQLESSPLASTDAPPK
jgi:hypothetical protein